MKRYLIIIYLLSMFLVIASCAKSTYAIIYNNSGSNLDIIADDKIYHLKHTETAKVIYPVMMKGFKIHTSNLELRYVVKYPSDAYVEHKPFEDIYLLQVEKDGSIYVLKPKTSMPTDKLDSQPNGFPLKHSNQ